MKVVSLVRMMLAMLALSATFSFINAGDAEARAGRGRSSGRSSFGSRQSPPPNYQSAPQQNGYNQPMQQPMQPNRGGFLRNMAGGIAGGFLGSMLFSSLGHAAGFGGGSGGIGLLEILLLGGLVFVAFRWWKSRQQQAAIAYNGGTLNRSFDAQFSPVATPQRSSFENMPISSFQALAPVAIDKETASDIFFRVQGAWTRRDLTRVQDVLGSEMAAVLEQDLNDLKRNKQINRLENISIRNVEISPSWRDGNQDFSSVRFSANLLDYTVDEQSGQVLEGNDAVPVKFEEDWVFAKEENAQNWKLVGINQI